MTVCVFGATRGPADDQVPKPPTGQTLEVRVAHLVEELAAESRALRLHAEEQLLRLGFDVLSLLPPAEQVTLPAAREALRRIRLQLEQEQAQRSAGPAQITLQGTLPLGEFLVSLSMQTGNRIDAGQLAPDTLATPVTLACAACPFWECVTQLERRSDIAFRPLPGTRALAAVLRSPAEDPEAGRAHAGPFRVLIRSMTRRPDFTRPGEDLLRLQGELVCEPRLRPLFLDVRDAQFEILSSAGSLRPLDEQARRETPMTSGSARWTVDFRDDRRISGERLTLRGRLQVELAAAEEPFVFRHLHESDAVSRRKAGVTVTRGPVVLAAGDGVARPRLLRVPLRIVYETGGPAFESHRTWVFHNEVFLRSTDGSQTLHHNGFDTLRQVEGGVEIAFRFDSPVSPQHPLADFELVYVAPTLLNTVPVEFEVGDLQIVPGRTALNVRNRPIPPQTAGGLTSLPVADRMPAVSRELRAGAGRLFTWAM
jgi:hypothetical protein